MFSVHKIGNHLKRILPRKFTKIPKGAQLLVPTRNSNLKYTFKKSIYLPETDINTSGLTYFPPIPTSENSFSIAIKAFSEKVLLYVNLKTVVTLSLTTLVCGTVIVKGGLNTDYNLIKLLLSQTNLIDSTVILKESLEFKVAEYIQSLKLEFARIVFPNNVSPCELLGEDVSASDPFRPVLNGLYVDLLTDYDLSDLDYNSNISTTGQEETETPNEPNKGTGVFKSLIGFFIPIIVSLISLASITTQGGISMFS